jgi:hypothetical protein
MYPWILWELVTDPLGSAEPTFGTTALGLYVLGRILVWDFSSFVQSCHVSATKCPEMLRFACTVTKQIRSTGKRKVVSCVI